MGKMKDALVKLAKKVTGQEVKDENSISNVVNFMADNYEGGSGGSVSGIYTMSGKAISAQALDLSDAYQFDFDKFMEYLEASGIDLDEVVIRPEEDSFTLRAGLTTGDETYPAIVEIDLTHTELAWIGSFTIADATSGAYAAFDDINTEATMTLREVIEYFATKLDENSHSLQDITSINFLINNDIYIYRAAISDYQYLEFKNMDKFLKEAFKPAGSGSGSGEIGS